jgi:hypothetical protein
MQKILANEGFPVHTRALLLSRDARVAVSPTQLQSCNLARILARHIAPAAQMLDLDAKTFFD